MNRRMNKSDTYVLFLDIRKAYDTVWRDGLLYKLYNKGVRGRYYKLLKAIYADSMSTVVCDGSESRAVLVHEGVRQGDPLSPILFNLYI